MSSLYTAAGKSINVLQVQVQEKAATAFSTAILIFSLSSAMVSLSPARISKASNTLSGIAFVAPESQRQRVALTLNERSGFGWIPVAARIASAAACKAL